jgi:hypothetical protein
MLAGWDRVCEERESGTLQHLSAVMSTGVAVADETVSVSAISPVKAALVSVSQPFMLAQFVTAVVELIESNSWSELKGGLPPDATVSSLWAVCQAAGQHRFLRTAFREWLAMLRDPGASAELIQTAEVKLADSPQEALEAIPGALRCHTTQILWDASPVSSGAPSSLLHHGYAFLAAEAITYRRIIVTRAVWDGKSLGIEPKDTVMGVLLPWELDDGATWADIASTAWHEHKQHRQQRKLREAEQAGEKWKSSTSAWWGSDPLGWVEAAAEDAAMAPGTLLRSLHMYCSTVERPHSHTQESHYGGSGGGLLFRSEMGVCQDLPSGWAAVASLLAARPAAGPSDSFVAVMEQVCRQDSAGKVPRASLRIALSQLWPSLTAEAQQCPANAEMASPSADPGHIDEYLVLLLVAALLALAAGVQWLLCGTD